ncbi:aminotransferase class I/II-fold pyridoxal phosphate-dependent enzyme, partial [Francisella tularensis subsp. holarctica]|uniref:aminotransferase class I/II-fold pyridoxal phosphate-dependent enzyme n=1 Tax=Francisella tularensis TaxID=263 RepID=UPI002381BE0B
NTDIDKLSSRLKQIHQGNKIQFIMMDSVGSMGKIYPVKEIVELVNTYNGYVYFDDAHGMSIIGKNGRGYVLKELDSRLHDRVFI